MTRKHPDVVKEYVEAVIRYVAGSHDTEIPRVADCISPTHLQGMAKDDEPLRPVCPRDRLKTKTPEQRRWIAELLVARAGQAVLEGRASDYWTLPDHRIADYPSGSMVEPVSAALDSLMQTATSSAKLAIGPGGMAPGVGL